MPELARCIGCFNRAVEFHILAPHQLEAFTGAVIVKSGQRFNRNDDITDNEAITIITSITAHAI